MDTSKHTVTIPIEDYNTMIAQIKTLNEYSQDMRLKLGQIKHVMTVHGMDRLKRFDAIHGILELK